jgi:hypothetical protein
MYGDDIMIPHLVDFQLVILVLLWLCIMLSHLWPGPPGGVSKTPTQPIQPKRKRSPEPKAFAGLPQKPPCAWCEQQTKEPALAPPRRPAPMPPTNRRPRTVDTSTHCCPHLGWYHLKNPWLKSPCCSGLPAGEKTDILACSTRHVSPLEHAALCSKTLTCTASPMNRHANS